MNADFNEGKAAVEQLLALVGCIEFRDHLADALGDLVDVPLNLNNLDATMMRLRGAAEVLATWVQEARHVSC